MKDRLPALDGLRGFAAMSVVLGHVAFSDLGAGSFPFISIILIAISAAHNAVQILFVLSGFLIAYLYPVVPSPFHFIKKRYARVFPIYGTIVIFLWLLTFKIVTWYLQLAILAALALFIAVVWHLLNKRLHLKKIGTIIFLSFIALQIVVLLFNIVFTQRIIIANYITLPDIQNNFLRMITNLTFTTQLVRGMPASSGVFWSLGAEILFYIIYPFVVVPIVQVAKKRGPIISVLIIIGVTKILLDLDYAVMSIAGLNGMNIARANGFVAGVTVGAIYQSQGSIWHHLRKFVVHPSFGLLAILILILVQLGEHIVGLGSIQFMNYFYLITSWLIAIVILNAVIPNSLTHKIFRGRIITFLGLISYSLYLIHSHIIPWAHQIIKPFIPFITNKKSVDILVDIIYVLISIGISYFLFRTVEFLYFESKKKIIATTSASYKEKVSSKSDGFSTKGYLIIIVVSIAILTYLYAGSYSLRLLVDRQTFNNSNITRDKEVPLWGQDAVISFTSGQDNLSVIGFDMRYFGSAGLTKANIKNPAKLKFVLSDDNNQEIFTSMINAYEVEGSPRFQFGFPTIADSKGKDYKIRLSLLNGKPNDNVILNTSSTSFISISTINKTFIIHYPFMLIINRIFFVLTNINYDFVILFLFFLIILSRKDISLRKKRIL